MHVLSKDKVARVRDLNDRFIKRFQGGKILLTQSVSDLPDMVKAAALYEAQKFDAFTEANEPTNEHDFMMFEFCNFIFRLHTTIRKWNAGHQTRQILT
jgi:hypothetical protein